MGINVLRDFGHDVPGGKITAQQAVTLNRVEEELPSAPVAYMADEMELQEITKNAAKSTEDLIEQFEGEEMLPMQELLGLNKHLRSIRGSLKVEVAKNIKLKQHIEWEKHKLEEFRDYYGVYDDGMREDIMKQIDELNDELKARRESIDPLKGKLLNQVTNFKETIAKVLDKDTSLAEKIKTLFKEQGITIASVLKAIEINGYRCTC